MLTPSAANYLGNIHSFGSSSKFTDPNSCSLGRHERCCPPLELGLALSLGRSQFYAAMVASSCDQKTLQRKYGGKFATFCWKQVAVWFSKYACERSCSKMV